MSKEIKFRVKTMWCDEVRVAPVVSIDSLEHLHGYCHVELSSYSVDRHDWDTHCGDVLMQYIGLKDKNGVEIYEGDIVVVTESGANGFSSRHKVVNWTNENYPAFDLYPPVYDELNSFSAISGFGDHTVEVIGNIYETPELLEAK